MHPFPLPLPRPRNEDQRLYAQAYRCLMAASWQHAIWSKVRLTPLGTPWPSLAEPDEVNRGYNSLVYRDELIEGAAVYLQLRADLRERAPS